ncbi:hypothetical protein D3C86_2044730 [compost metagenome]
MSAPLAPAQQPAGSDPHGPVPFPDDDAPAFEFEDEPPAPAIARPALAPELLVARPDARAPGANGPSPERASDLVSRTADIFNGKVIEPTI